MNPSTNRDILVRSQQSGQWVRPNTSTVSNEAELQNLIASSPTLVPGVTEGSVAVTELRSGVGPADICIISPTGAITIVECKLATNAEVRRKIVGQVLDYASQIWGMTFHQLDSRWRQRNDGQGIVEALGAIDFTLAADIESNLQTGAFDLVLAVDRINDDLRRIIEYLNHITPASTSIVALELRYANHDGVDILVPSVFGAELTHDASLAGPDANSTGKQRWTLEGVVDFLATHEPPCAEFVQSLFDLSEATGWTVIGTHAAEPSAIIGLEVAGGELWPLTIYCSSKGSVISTNFQWTHRASAEARSIFLTELAKKIPTIDETAIREADLSKRPGHNLLDVVDAVTPEELVQITSLLEEL